jgi:hypothetical protein
MSLRAPQHYGPSATSDFNPLDHEIAAEKAAALGRAGWKVEQTLAKLRQHGENQELRTFLLRDAAEAVHAYFIQRELCGMRRHDGVIREYDIPKAVLVRLGAK